MSRTRHILFCGTGGMSNASARARVFCYLPELAARGIHAHVASYPYHRAHTNRARFFEKLWLELLPLRNVLAFLRADAVYFYRLNFSCGTVRLARLLGKRVIHDFDDAVHLHPPDSAEYDNGTHKARAEKLNWMLRRASTVLVSTPPLEEYAKRLARNVCRLPSVFARIADEPSVTRTPLVIGWVGAPENQRYLRRLEAAISHLLKERPELEVWIITSQPADPPLNFRHRFIPWSRAAEAENIPRFTVGLAPLDDDAWCLAKMNFKALVYMSHGVPAVVSPGGFPEADFEHGESVWYARDEDEWLAAMRMALEDQAKRDDVARGALRVLREKYTAAAQAQNWIAALLVE
jgi:glycosyltransferase involved in cell wall biosynthesis